MLFMNVKDKWMDRIAVNAKTVNMIVVVVSVHVLTTRTLVAMIVCCTVGYGIFRISDHQTTLVAMTVCCTVGYGIFRSLDGTSCNDCLLYCRLWYIQIIRRH